MNDDVDQLLQNLNMNKIREIYGEKLRVAQEQDLSYGAFLVSLLRPQWYDRQERAHAGRVKRANLPERWSLETFPFDLQPGVSRRQINTLAELRFMIDAENLVFIGGTGVGKTGLGIGILMKAIDNGLRCRFVKAQDLFDEMYASLADRSSRKLVNTLAKLDLLLIDELGYLNIKPEQANIFFNYAEKLVMQSDAGASQCQQSFGGSCSPHNEACFSRARSLSGGLKEPFCRTIGVMPLTASSFCIGSALV